MVTIVAPSGLGIALANELTRRIELDGGIVCAGKFDIQNRADPYQAFVEALGSFVRQILPQKEKRAELRSLVNDAIGEEAEVLVELIPSITRLLKDRTSITSNTKRHSSVTERNITERASRIQNVLVEFLKLCSTKDCPLTIVLDDLQWSSTASLGLIEAILKDDRLNGFFLLTTCRDAYLRKEDKKGEQTTFFSVSVSGSTAFIEESYPQ